MSSRVPFLSELLEDVLQHKNRCKQASQETQALTRTGKP